jgi:hypothetical protein
MKTTLTVSLFALVISLIIPSAPLDSIAAGRYASYWKCSDGNTYGLSAAGSQRSFYSTDDNSLFFSGDKNGNTYAGTIYWANQQISVGGPVSNKDTRVTLRANDGRTWVFDFSHK